MKLSKKEREKMDVNLDAITEFCEDNVLPHIPDGDAFRVGFWTNDETGESLYSLNVGHDNIFITTSLLERYRKYELRKMPAKAAIRLLREWPEVKDALCAQCQEADEIRHLIQNFKV